MKTFAILLVFLVSGCASVGEGVLKAGTTGDNRFSPEDVDAAIVIAQRSKDPVAEACFKAVRKHLETEGAYETKGIVSTYAAARAKVRASRTGLAEDVHNACAPLVVDSGQFASRLGLKLAF